VSIKWRISPFTSLFLDIVLFAGIPFPLHVVETKQPNHGNFSKSPGFQDHVDERSEACIVSSALGIPSLHAEKGVCSVCFYWQSHPITWCKHKNSKTKPFKYSVIVANIKNPMLKWTQTLCWSHPYQRELPDKWLPVIARIPISSLFGKNLNCSYTLSNKISLLKENASQWEEHRCWCQKCRRITRQSSFRLCVPGSPTAWATRQLSKTFATLSCVYSLWKSKFSDILMEFLIFHFRFWSLWIWLRSEQILVLANE